MEEIEVDINPTTDDENTVESVHSNGRETHISTDNTKENLTKHKLVRLPLARVKAMMKKDPGCALLSQDAVFLVTKSTEMFIQFLAKEAGKQLAANKRKTVLRKDVDNAVESCPQLCFLDGALD